MRHSKRWVAIRQIQVFIQCCATWLAGVAIVSKQVWWSWLAFKAHRSILFVFVAQLFVKPTQIHSSSLAKRLLLLLVYIIKWAHTHTRRPQTELLCLRSQRPSLQFCSTHSEVTEKHSFVCHTQYFAGGAAAEKCVNYCKSEFLIQNKRRRKKSIANKSATSCQFIF